MQHSFSLVPPRFDQGEDQFLAVDYAGFAPILVEGLHEHGRNLEALIHRVAALERSTGSSSSVIDTNNYSCTNVGGGTDVWSEDLFTPCCPPPVRAAATAPGRGQAHAASQPIKSNNGGDIHDKIVHGDFVHGEGQQLFAAADDDGVENDVLLEKIVDKVVARVVGDKGVTGEGYRVNGSVSDALIRIGRLEAELHEVRKLEVEMQELRKQLMLLLPPRPS